MSFVCLHPFLTETFLSRPPIADRGTFIAYGKLVASGRVLYRDLWDNKPPLIYLLGAFAWWLAADVRAVFQLERVALLLTAAVMFAMLRFALGIRPVPALAGLLIGLVTLRNPEVFNGGHLTEEYGILFQMAGITCLGLARRRTCDGTSSAWAAAAGVCAALMLLTRQTFLASLVAIWLAVHAPLVRERRTLTRLFAWELGGFALPVLAWLAYLWTNGAFGAFLELVPETFLFAQSPYKPPITAAMARDLNWPAGWSRGVAAYQGAASVKAIRGLQWLVALVFHGNIAVAIATALIAVVAVAVAFVRRRRGTPPMTVTA